MVTIIFTLFWGSLENYNHSYTQGATYGFFPMQVVELALEAVK
jgi:hypothetical protein